MSNKAVRTVGPDEVAQIKAQFKRFIDEEVIPAEPELNRHDEVSAAKLDELKARAKEAGLWALGHPEEIGGGGLPFLAFAEMNEIIGRSHYGQMAVGSVSMQDSIMLHLYANSAQKERWLKPLVAGEIYPSVGLTEPEVAGSDPTLMRTTAHLDGNEWVINGHKWFTTGANRAAFTTVFCDTEPDAEKHAKFSSIIARWARPMAVIARSGSRMFGSRKRTCSERVARAS